jgi:hypothetical protein
LSAQYVERQSASYGMEASSGFSLFGMLPAEASNPTCRYRNTLANRLRLAATPEIPQAEATRLAEGSLAHIAAQVNALTPAVRAVAAAHVCLVDVFLPRRDPSGDEPLLDGSETLVVLAHSRHDFNTGDEPRPLVCCFRHLQFVAYLSLTALAAIAYLGIMRRRDDITFSLSSMA